MKNPDNKFGSVILASGEEVTVQEAIKREQQRQMDYLIVDAPKNDSFSFASRVSFTNLDKLPPECLEPTMINKLFQKIRDEELDRFFSNDEEMQKRRNLFNKTDLREARKDKNAFRIKQRISQQLHNNKQTKTI